MTEYLPPLPEPHVLNGHYRDHVDSINGFSLSQLEEYGDARAAHARKAAPEDAAAEIAVLTAERDSAYRMLTELETKLTALEKQEPAGTKPPWTTCPDYDYDVVKVSTAPEQLLQSITEFGELQNQAPQARELSDAEIDKIAEEQDDPGEPWFVNRLTAIEWRGFARAVLAASKE